MTEEQIKIQMQDLLSAPTMDYSKLVALSSKLVGYDQSSIRFSVDADIITRLGHELVARQETALSELVKNAYDADAKNVVLTFENTSALGGTLIIEDDGCGMSREQLINGFMRISSNDKVLNPVSVLYHRKKSGRKGIGRFAVQRLGNKLTIITQSENSEYAYKVDFNWNEYVGSKDLSNISNKILLLPKQQVGTKLIIRGLKDVWVENSIKRIYRYIAGILLPIRFDEAAQRCELCDPGFTVRTYQKEGGVLNEVMHETPNVDSFAIASIDGGIDNDGNGYYSIKSDRLSIDFSGKIGYNSEDDDSAFANLKNVHLHAQYYLKEYIPKSQTLFVQDFLKTQGGIRLYRNGFRVLPYGEPGNDWVSLDLSIRRRSILPQHGNSNFQGFVEINDDSGDFEETSSREGLVENSAFIDLTNFVYRVLLSGVVFIAQVRNVKVTTNQKKDSEGNWETIGLRVRNIAFTLDELDKAIDHSNSESNKIASKEAIKKIKKDISDLKKLQKEERKRNSEEKVLLRVLSSVGLSIEQFVHEIKYYLNNINSDIRFLLNRIVEDADAINRLLILNNNFSTFKSYVSYFDSVVSDNVNRELRPVEMRMVVRKFIDSLSRDGVNSRIVIEEPIFEGYNLYTKPMHPSEWTSILFNFYTNAKKAIKRAAKADGSILIECGKDGGIIYLEFSDNGDGIPKEIEDKIFDEFFTTTTQRSIYEMNSMTEVTGTGLGLTIVRDIVNSYHGSVHVVNPKGSYKTCMRVEIPALTDKEIMNMINDN